jgi:long-subunit fatty acid transport protein
VDYLQKGKLASVSPAVGFELAEWMSIGATFNFWHSQLIPNNGWEIRQSEKQAPFWVNGVPQGALRTRYYREEEYKEFEGFNATIGVLFKPTERLSIGAVYHTKLEADVQYKFKARNRIGLLAPNVTWEERDKRMTFPSAFGIGVAYRFPGDKLTLSMDVTRREWDQFIIYDPENINRSLRRVSGVTGQNKRLASHDATWTVRLGGEYVFVNEKKPKQDYLPSIRAGIFYDPEPSGGRDTGGFFRGTSLAATRGDGSVDDYFGFSLGTGVLIKNRVNLDAAYIFRWGNGVRNDTFGFANTDADVRQHYLYLSTVIYF